MNELPRVAVVIPTLGRRLETLRLCLESVRSQSGVTVQVIVVAPLRATGLAELVDELGCELVIAEGHISAAVNAGFRHAARAVSYVAWLGDDDLLRPGALVSSTTLLSRDARATVAFGRCDFIDARQRLLFTRRAPPAAAWLMYLAPGLIKQETCLFRRDAVSAVGGLDEQLRFAMDLDLLLRLRKRGPFRRSEMSLAAFCWHADSLTIRSRRESFAEAQAIQLRHAGPALRSALKILQPFLFKILMNMSSRVSFRYLEDA